MSDADDNQPVLTEEEIEKISAAVVALAKKNCGAILRG